MPSPAVNTSTVASHPLGVAVSSSIDNDSRCIPADSNPPVTLSLSCWILLSRHHVQSIRTRLTHGTAIFISQTLISFDGFAGRILGSRPQSVPSQLILSIALHICWEDLSLLVSSHRGSRRIQERQRRMPNCRNSGVGIGGREPNWTPNAPALFVFRRKVIDHARILPDEITSVPA